jgi:cytosine/adenosine deaminase-related metal-dependent hydrolase
LRSIGQNLGAGARRNMLENLLTISTDEDWWEDAQLNALERLNSGTERAVSFEEMIDNCDRLLSEKANTPGGIVDYGVACASGRVEPVELNG